MPPPQGATLVTPTAPPRGATPIDAPDTPAPIAPTDSFLGRVGDWLIDNTLNGPSAAMRENARTGAFAQDAAQNEGFLDRAGSLLERGGAYVDQGIYNFLGALGSARGREEAASLARGITGQDIAGSTTWDQANDLGSLASFALDTGIESLPAMAAIATPYAGLPIIAGSQTGNIGAQRAANDGRDTATPQDLLDASPAALLSTALDRFGIKGITNPVGHTIAGRVAGAGLREGLTEGAQSGIEYAGGTVGTETPFDVLTALDQMAQGAVGGAGAGAGVHGGHEAVSPAVNLVRTRTGQAASSAPAGATPIEDDWEGSLDDLMGTDAPRGATLALPSPEMVQRDEAARTSNDVDSIIDAYMGRTRGAESGGNDRAANPNSSADGRYQFIDSTWAAYHRRIYGGDGLNDKFDPAKQERIMREFTRDNAKALQRAGVPINEATLYQAHHFGSAGAIAMHSNPNAAVDPTVVSANPQFKGMTNAEALAWTQRHHGGAGGAAAVAPEADVAIDVPGADGSLLQRGGDERIANLDIPEATPGQREAGAATPIDISPDEGAQIEQADDMGTLGRDTYNRQHGSLWLKTPAELDQIHASAQSNERAELQRAVDLIGFTPSPALAQTLQSDGFNWDRAAAKIEKEAAAAGKTVPANAERILNPKWGDPQTSNLPMSEDVEQLRAAIANGAGNDPHQLASEIGWAMRGLSEDDAAAVLAGSGPISAQAKMLTVRLATERMAELGVPANEIPGRVSGAMVQNGVPKETAAELTELIFKNFAAGVSKSVTPSQRDLLAPTPETAYNAPDARTEQPAGSPATATGPAPDEQDAGPRGAVPTLARGQLRALGIARELRIEKAAALVGRTASTPRELAQIAQVYRDPRYETFRIFLTKGDVIVHATGVSSRSTSEAPLMPDGVSSRGFIEAMKQTMRDIGADGYYLLHNHPSGDPTPSYADAAVTRDMAAEVPGFRSHVVINSNKYAQITPNERGINKASVHALGEGEEKLIAASVPHDILGRQIEHGKQLVALGKEVQKPGWITVIGTNSKGVVRVVVDYPESSVKNDVKSLMAMARRVQRQSGSASLFLVGDRKALDTPVVKRALSGGIVTAAIDEDGRPIDSYGRSKKNALPKSPGRMVAEDAVDFPRGKSNDPGPDLADKLVDKEGLTRDLDRIKSIVGNPIKALGALGKGSFAQMGRAYFYTMDARLRGLAKRYDSQAINDLADLFHARAGVVDKAVDETYHEAVDREGFGRAGQMWRAIEPFAGDKEAMNRIGMMLRDPTSRQRGRRAEAEAAAKVAKLLKDTIEYRKAAGEDIGEVTDGYFPRMLDVEKVVKNRDLFLRQATELYKRHGADNPKASAEAWLARTFDQYAGLDGGLDFIDLFHDTRPAGVGRKTAKSREFGKDADKLLGEFYDNDTGSVLTGYFIGAARKAEEARRFGPGSTGQAKLKTLFNRIKSDIRKSGEDAGDTIDEIARMVATNLGRSGTPPAAVRTAASILHTAGQLGTLDRATITSLSEAMMGFVRAGPRYGTQMLIDSGKEFARQLRKAPPSEAARMAEALGIAHDAMIGEALAARAGFERGNTTRRAQKVQQGYYKATGLHQWTEGTRVAATRMGQAFLRDLAVEMEGRNPKRAAEYLTELGVKDPKAFAKWLNDGGAPTPESLMGQQAGAMEQQYRTAMVRFANQTIMKPSRAEKPRWSSHPVGALFFSLLSYSYGFKKNVLDRTGRMATKAMKEGDPTLLYPAFGLAGLFAVHTVINSVLRQAIFGGGREDDEEGIDLMDLMEAVDRAGLFGAASPLMNAIWGLKYRRGVGESLVGPVVGRPFDLADKTVGLAYNNSPKTNSAERAAAGALYDIVLEPAMEAYGVTRFKGPLAAGVVWGTGNRKGGVIPPDRDIFVDAVAGPKKD